MKYHLLSLKYRQVLYKCVDLICGLLCSTNCFSHCIGIHFITFRIQTVGHVDNSVYDCDLKFKLIFIQESPVVKYGHK